MDKFEQIIAIRRQLFALDKKKTKMEEGDKGLEGSCWEGYIAIGTKVTEDGRTVPNCVPDPEQMKKIKKEGFPIPSPESSEDEQAYISRCISNIIDEYGQEQSAAICYNRWENQ
jgi:hypothetical protein